MRVRRTTAAPGLYRWEWRWLIAGFVAPLILFLLTRNWAILASAGSISGVCFIVVGSMLTNKYFRKAEINLERAQEGWYAVLSREFKVLSFLNVVLGVYGTSLWGWGEHLGRLLSRANQ